MQNNKYVELLITVGTNRAGIYPAEDHPIYVDWATRKLTNSGQLIAEFVEDKPEKLTISDFPNRIGTVGLHKIADDKETLFGAEREYIDKFIYTWYDKLPDEDFPYPELIDDDEDIGNNDSDNDKEPEHEE